MVHSTVIFKKEKKKKKNVYNTKTTNQVGLFSYWQCSFTDRYQLYKTVFLRNACLSEGFQQKSETVCKQLSLALSEHLQHTIVGFNTEWSNILKKPQKSKAFSENATFTGRKKNGVCVCWVGG